jgi:dGTP triphosphohydrolase
MKYDFLAQRRSHSALDCIHDHRTPSERDLVRHRVICDYIAGMTDEYATRMYERLFMPRQGTVFQRL